MKIGLLGLGLLMIAISQPAAEEHVDLFSRPIRRRENNNGDGGYNHHPLLMRSLQEEPWLGARHPRPSGNDMLLLTPSSSATPLATATGAAERGGVPVTTTTTTKLDNKECFKCNRRFRTPSLLRNHIRIHNGEKPYNCRVCNRSFSEKGNMAKHFQAVHKNARPYVCVTCNRNFSQKHQLISHHEAFHAKRTFACLICSRNCTSNRQLRLHAMRHGPNAKRLQCQDCLHVFSTAWYLNRVHKRYGLCRGSNGNISSFQCPHCKKSYEDERRLRIHMKAFHSDRKEEEEEEDYEEEEEEHLRLIRKFNTSSYSSSFSSRVERLAGALPSSALAVSEKGGGVGGGEGIQKQQHQQNGSSDANFSSGSFGHLFNEMIGSSKLQHRGSNF